ncbi:hypothetical protein ACJRPK_09135 [Aquimarina sp. 2-A2]|uniref:hypothetical protein n=1 Tax=Aquimarina sp. 2-A2 TaxID=3382644 RepID=UPI00387F0617
MEKISKSVSNLRSNFNILLLAAKDSQNNVLSATEAIGDLSSINQNTQFEEIVCVSYIPKNEVINATVKIKQASGYGGNACSKGTFEYVRFYFDYDRNGNWVDEGVTNFNAHSLGFDEDLCYNVQLKIDPDKRRCCDKKPVLPKVRAILSWNAAPPANQPNWTPYWGNVIERNVQIEPLRGFQCFFDDFVLYPKFKKIDTILKKNNLLPDFKNISIKDQVEIIKKHKIPATRFGYASAIKKINSQDATPFALPGYLNQLDFDFSNILDFLLKPKFNTTYEELTCVALNRAMTTLHGTIHLKKSAGYSGNLCQTGSKEYVAFYMDFGSGWEYMGTSSITVHNISEIPKDGLNYNVALAVDLDKKRKEWCESGKAKLKGILSWNVAPPINQPNHVAHWGDWEQCHVEVKSLPKGIIPGNLSLNIETLGSMHIDDIDQTDGLANGSDALGLSINAEESPFDGKINFTGSLINGGATALEYRLVITPPSSGAYNLLNHVTADKIGFSGEETLIPDADGWMPYTKFVGNYLGYFIPTQSGMHTIKIEVRNAGSASLLLTGNSTNFMAHKEAPVADVEITSGAGNCGSFKPGDVISGEYKALSEYPRVMSFVVTPSPESNSGVISIDGVPGNSISYNDIVAPGKTGTWELATNNMPQCGYNIRLSVYDRTIMHSKNITRHATDIEGFCLIPK